MKKLVSVLAAFIFAGSACAKDAPKDDAPINATAFAIFAGGCFWCMESDFEHLDGVGDVISGYAGGLKQDPTYKDHEGHLEVVKVPYDPSIVSYRELVDYFFRHVDPLDGGGQFCDRGHSYKTAIFYANGEYVRDISFQYHRVHFSLETF